MPRLRLFLISHQHHMSRARTMYWIHQNRPVCHRQMLQHRAQPVVWLRRRHQMARSDLQKVKFLYRLVQIRRAVAPEYGLNKNGYSILSPKSGDFFYKNYIHQCVILSAAKNPVIYYNGII